jgi:ABC-2 type transport system ATP-binding protein
VFAVEVVDLVKSFRRREAPALDRVSLTVARGECVAVLGQNGSGKSTLVRVLATLLLHESGQARVFGHDVRGEEKAVRRLVNRVSVEASFFKRMSATENLSYSARFYGLTPARTRRRVPEILDAVGFPAKRARAPMEDLSRGMQQKVALARALLTAPTLLLLDEPTTGLDPRSKLDVQTFIEELRDTHDATIVLTTHDLAEADRLCDRIGIINDGRIVVEDTPEGLKAKVADERGLEPTMESVFMTYTGRSLDDDLGDNEEKDDED